MPRASRRSIVSCALGTRNVVQGIDRDRAIGEDEVRRFFSDGEGARAAKQCGQKNVLAGTSWCMYSQRGWDTGTTG